MTEMKNGQPAARFFVLIAGGGFVMIAVFCADRNWGIGRKGSPLVQMKSDTKRFQDITYGKVVILGRRTLETLPGGQPYKGRKNLVLTRDPFYKARGAELIYSLEDLAEAIRGYDRDEVFVAGGGEVFEQLLPYCDTALVTRVDMAYQADTYVTNLDEDPEWQQVACSEEQTCFDIEFYFTEYHRKTPAPEFLP